MSPNQSKTDGKTSYYRSLPCDRIKNNKIVPEMDQNRDYGIGFYTGQPSCWIPIMMRDGIIYRTLNDLCIVKFTPPKGLPIIANNVERCFEEFIVTDQPLSIDKKVEILFDDPDILEEIDEAIQDAGFQPLDEDMNRYTYFR